MCCCGSGCVVAANHAARFKNPMPRRDTARIQPVLLHVPELLDLGAWAHHAHNVLLRELGVGVDLVGDDDRQAEDLQAVLDGLGQILGGAGELLDLAQGLGLRRGA